MARRFPNVITPAAVSFNTENTTTPPSESDPSSGGPNAHEEVPALVILWSKHEPLRAGERGLLCDSARWVVGRGSEEAAYPRVEFYREQPGSIRKTPSLSGNSLSRTQLRLIARAAAGFEIINDGKQTMLTVNGVPVSDRTFVRDGDIIGLLPHYLFLMTTRPRVLPATDYPTSHAFGDADAHGILGESPAAWKLRAEIAIAAHSPRHALVTGESGAGKELVAAALHAQSSRAAAAFVACNAATLPPGVAAAALFGNVRNFPNVGMPERAGLFGEAHRGTLLLDEIGEMPIEVQAQLLRALDRGEVQPLGEAKTRHVDVRVIGATNRDPSALKHDLLARLTTRIEVPSLRARREDIPLLARHLVMRHAEETPYVAARFVERADDGTQQIRIDPAVIAALVSRAYTTNVRELDRLLWDAICATTGDTLRMTDELTAAQPTPPRAPGLRKIPVELPDPEAPSIADVLAGVGRERSEADVRAALINNDGVIAKAARELGIERTRLYRLLDKYEIRTVQRATPPKPDEERESSEHAGAPIEIV